MIRIARPQLGQDELDAIRKVLDSGFLVQGPAVARFEQLLCGATGARHAAAVSSGTAALHLALLALGVGPGDEVVTSAFTFPATANAIEVTGARPVFVDIDPATFNVRPEAVAAAISPRTRAIMPVHEFGLMSDMGAIGAAAARGPAIPVIEDAACALGASQSIDGRSASAGTIGTIGCFSFHPRKSITTGEGGCLTTSDAALDATIRRLRDHGIDRSAPAGIDFVDAGLNYRLTDMQGALGTVQMQRLDTMLSERRRLAVRYSERLRDIPDVVLPSEPAGFRHAYQSYVVLLPETLTRQAVIDDLKAAGVESVRGAYAVHRLAYYRRRYNHRAEAFPGALRADESSLALPLYPGMTDEAVDTVAEALRRACAACRA